MHALKNPVLKKLFQITNGGPKDWIQPVLSLRVGERHCSFAIVDKASKTLQSLCYYTSERINAPRLGALTATHPDLNRTFQAIFVCYDYPQNMLVPAGDEQLKEPGPLVSTIYRSTESPVMISEPVKRLDLQNTFWVPAQIHEWVTGKYPTARFCHEYSLLIQTLEVSEATNCLVIDFRKEDFVVLAIKNGQVKLVQTFCYVTPDDVLFYLLKVCGQFSLSQQEVQLRLSGLIDRQSALYNSLYQYFIQVEFRMPVWKSQDHQYPAHFFTSLNDLALCES